MAGVVTCDLCHRETDHLAWQLRETGRVKRLCRDCEGLVGMLDGILPPKPGVAS